MVKFYSDFQRADSFETWFVGLLSSWDTSQSKVFTHTLRGVKRELFEEYCRLLDGGDPRATARALICDEVGVSELDQKRKA